MAGKKKTTRSTRSSARLNTNNKASTSLKVMLNDSSLVEPASPSFASEEASSTSGDLLECFNVLEAGGKFQDYEDGKNQAKALLAKELIFESNVQIQKEKCSSLEIFSSSPIGAQREPTVDAQSLARDAYRSGVIPFGENDVDRLHGDMTGSGSSLGTRSTLPASGPAFRLGKSNSQAIPDTCPPVFSPENQNVDFPPLQSTSPKHRLGTASNPSSPKTSSPKAVPLGSDVLPINPTFKITELQPEPKRDNKSIKEPQEKKNAWKKPLRFGFKPTNTDPTIDWENEFAGQMESNLHFEEELKVNYVDGKRDVEDPPADLYEEGNGLWLSCLVGQFLGAPPPLIMIKRMVENAWWKYGKVEIITKGKGMFIFQFETEKACQSVLQQLWHVNNRVLLLRKWSPKMDYINMLGTCVPLWIKFEDVPLCLWSKRGLNYVSSFIGRPLQMDALTASRKNLEFARVCIEVNLEEELPEIVYPKMVDGSRVPVKVIYAWKPTMCTFCKMVGHEQDACPKKKAEEDQPKPVTNQPVHFNPNAPFPKPKPGTRNEWTTVNRRKAHEPNSATENPAKSTQQITQTSNPPNFPTHQPNYQTQKDTRNFASSNAFKALAQNEEENEIQDTGEHPHGRANNEVFIAEANNGQEEGDCLLYPPNRVLSLNSIPHSFP